MGTVSQITDYKQAMDWHELAQLLDVWDDDEMQELREATYYEELGDDSGYT